MAQKISQMTEQTTASMTEAGTSDFLGGYTATGGDANRKFSLSGLANYFLNKFKMTLGGSSQTVKSAIDALNSNTKEDIPNLVSGFNQWNNGVLVQGSISSGGSDSVSYSRLRSPFVHVMPGATYYISSNELSDSSILVYEVHFYKKDKTWSAYASKNARSGTFTVPANCVYMKFLLRKSSDAAITPREVDTTKLILNISDTNLNGTYLPYDGLDIKAESRFQRIPADGVKSFDVHLSKSDWTCGILICNINGGGNGVVYFAITNTGITMTDMVGYLAQGNQLSATIDGKTLTINTIVGNNSFSCGCWIGDSAM